MARYLQVSHEIASNIESGLLSPGVVLAAAEVLLEVALTIP